MRTHFGAYYRPTAEEFQRLHEEAVVSVDTNVLLNLYRYSAETRDDLINLFEKLAPRLWLTHQAALEFHENRLGVIAGRLSALKEARQLLAATRGQLNAKLTELYRSPSKEFQVRWSKVADVWGGLETYIEEREKEAIQPSCDIGDDPIWGAVATLFEERVGDPYSIDERKSLLEEGKRRFERRLPPGYHDSAKGGEGQFGDWLMWRELIDHARTVDKPIVLVTDDRKEDWWVVVSGRTIGPRPELTEEMRREADQAFYMYQPRQFREVFGAALQQRASGDTLKEMTDLPPIWEEAAISTPGRVPDRYEVNRLVSQARVLSKRIASLDRDIAERPMLFGDAWKAERERLSNALRANERKIRDLLDAAMGDQGRLFEIVEGPEDARILGQYPYANGLSHDDGIDGYT